MLRKRVLSLFLGLVTCLGTVIVSMISPGHALIPSSGTSTDSSTVRPFLTAYPAYPIDHDLLTHLQAAEAVFLAQGGTQVRARYVAVMQGKEVVPSAVNTLAFGTAGAILIGDRLVIRGDFSQLTSSLRDYTTDPLNPPNPNITSGVHIHRGTPDQNGPFQYALTVEMRGDTAGRFRGEYTLTPEQKQALANGQLYLDIHTKQNRAGELRGILRPY